MWEIQAFEIAERALTKNKFRKMKSMHHVLVALEEEKK